MTNVLNDSETGHDKNTTGTATKGTGTKGTGTKGTGTKITIDDCASKVLTVKNY